MFRSLILAALTALSLSAAAAVDVNKASKAELEALPGVGPALSGRILAERQKASFKDWPDLIERVRGVGPGSAGKLSQGGLTVGAAAYKGGGAAPSAKPGAGATPAAAKPATPQTAKPDSKPDTKPAPRS